METLEMIRENIASAIQTSQHCQRNWDLTKQIPQEDLDIIISAVTQCPSKQNVAHYNVHAITNRQIIERIHSFTDGFVVNYETGQSTTNTQVLANLLLVFESKAIAADKIDRNTQVKDLHEGTATDWDHANLERDRHMAIGIAAGYCNLTSSLLGYRTGCCACFSEQDIRKLLNLKGEVVLMMGVGYKNEELNRRISQVDPNFMFPTKIKQPIDVKFYK